MKADLRKLPNREIWYQGKPAKPETAMPGRLLELTQGGLAIIICETAMFGTPYRVEDVPYGKGIAGHWWWHDPKKQHVITMKNLDAEMPPEDVIPDWLEALELPKPKTESEGNEQRNTDSAGTIAGADAEAPESTKIVGSGQRFKAPKTA